MRQENTGSIAARERLADLIRRSPCDSYASVSALIGRNHAYIQQYIQRGQPRFLSEGDRRTIARHFNVPDSELGGPVMSPGEMPGDENDALISHIPRYDIRASAGHGTFVENERPNDYVPFRRDHLRKLSQAKPQDLSILTVLGDSMHPTLADGDEILVDRADRQPFRDAIYVLRLEGALQVKRVSINPVTSRLSIRSDNPLYESWHDCDPGRIDIIGRVIWVGRRL